MLYLGRQAVPHAADAVAAARRAGVRVAFVTNNASRPPAAVAEHLTQLAIPAAAGDVVTSGQAAARLVADAVPPGSVVLAVGAPTLADEIAARGMRPVASLEEAGDLPVAAVVQGLARTTTWQQLADAARAVHAGALWVAANRDATLPSPYGPLPGNGTMVDAVRVATGREPVVAGKPEPALHEESVRRVRSVRPLVVGDRLDTDVLGAVRAGAQSLLVLTGVVDALGALQAPAGSRPDFVAADLRALAVPHAPVELVEGGAVCDGRRATVRDGLVHATGDLDELATLRAACAAAWTAADRAEPVRGIA